MFNNELNEIKIALENQQDKSDVEMNLLNSISAYLEPDVSFELTEAQDRVTKNLIIIKPSGKICPICHKPLIIEIQNEG